ncbi:MAG TPA: hypothetical protein VN742_04515, partial [Candidatus Binataceae bacterium]|nr:hypothetical protein [Candidatus Binataceae bacterium]
KGAHRMKLADADEAVMRLNQEWQIDGTPGDVILLDRAGGAEQVVRQWSAAERASESASRVQESESASRGQR